MALNTSTLIKEGDAITIALAQWDDPLFAQFDCLFTAADAWGVWVEGGHFAPMPLTMLPWHAIERIEVIR